MLTQMKHDFPNMYLVAMRGDARVRLAAGHMLTAHELTSSEGQSDELIFLEDFAELAEEAGMNDTADELREIAGNPKRKAKEA